MRVLYPFAKRFIAGEDLNTALKSIEKLWNSGFLSSMDLLGEDVTSLEQAARSKEAYLNLLSATNGASHPMDFSVKLTQMGLDLDKDFCGKNLEEILRAAGRHTVRFDMEGSSHTEDTLNLCVDLHENYKNLGQAVQAYLFRTQADVENLIDRGISVRLCKGAYKEKASIAYQSMDAIRENFLRIAYLLLKEGFLPAIATHDEHLLVKILAFIEKEKIDKRSLYFEMLYGVGRDLQKILLDKGFPVRVYVPYGKSWLPYTLRRLMEKKENILFVLKHLFRETLGLRRLQ